MHNHIGTSEPDACGGARRPMAALGVQALPADLLRDVFARLTPHEQASQAALSCREWRQIARPPLSYRLIEGLRHAEDATQICRLLAAEAPRVARELTHLDLRDRQLGDAGVARVCAWLDAHAGGLHFLDLGGNALTSAGAAALALPRGLRVLNLSDNLLGGEAGPAPAALALQLPSGLEGINLSCHPQLGDAYLGAQTWPASLTLFAASHCALEQWRPPLELSRLAHLDVAFNERFAHHTFPGVAHLDVRGTRSWQAVTGALHEQHPLPDIERLLLVPVRDAAPRALHSRDGVTSIGIAGGLALTVALAAHANLFQIALAGLIGGLNAALLHAAAADWHTSRHARANKRGGEAWYSHAEGTARLVPMPPGAAALRVVANGAIGALAGAGYVAVAVGGEVLGGLIVGAGIDLATRANASFDGSGLAFAGMLTAIVVTGIPVATAYGYTLWRLPQVTMRTTQWAGQHAAARTYELAAWLQSRERGRPADAGGRSAHRYVPLADIV